MVAAEERRLAAKNGEGEPKGKAANEKDAVAPPTTN